jgi:hypothetical protein
VLFSFGVFAVDDETHTAARKTSPGAMNNQASERDLNTGHHKLYAMTMLVIHQPAIVKNLHQDAKIRIAQADPVDVV